MRYLKQFPESKEKNKNMNEQDLHKINNSFNSSSNINNNESGKNLSKNSTNDSNSNQEIKSNESKSEEDEFLIDLKKSMNPQALEFFEIQERIGKGSECYVYKSIAKKSKRTIALKIISKKKVKNIHNELNLLKKLRNKNLVNYYGAFIIKKDEYDCIMMNYGKFGNLINFQNNIINKNYFSESILCFLSYQILCGLKYLHQCKICHFDIKPQNIIIEDSLNVQIIDYSISEDYSKIKTQKIQLPFRGTSFFIAPEVFRTDTIDIKDINKIDLYSFGVILYYLAFGYFPFNLKNEDIKKYDVIYQKIMQDLIINNEDNYYSHHFIDFLKRLLEKDINKRININEALNHYWIKGAKILFDEKEKLFNASRFLSYLVADHIKNFDDYIKKTI